MARPEQEQRYIKEIEDRLDGTWNGIFFHRIALRIIPGHAGEKDLENRIKKIAAKRGLEYKIKINKMYAHVDFIKEINNEA